MMHRLVERSILSVVAAGLLWSLPAHAGYEGAYKQGRRAFEYGKWEKAASFFRKALEDNDESGEMIRIYGVKMEPYLPYYYLGAALYEMGEHRQALEQWELAIEQKAVQESDLWEALVEARRAAEASLTGPSAGGPDPGIVVADSLPSGPPSTAPAPIEGGQTDVGPVSRPAVDVADLGLPESHALVVGVSEYRDRAAWQSLPGVLEDVQEVRASLRRHGFQVQLLLDPNKRQIVDAMEDFFYTTSKNEASRLLFYYAGHGATVTEGLVRRGYLVPADAPSPEENPSLFRRRAVSMARFQEYADESPARHIAFLYDSCFSGSIFEVMRSGLVRGSVQEKIQEKSRTFIAAGDADQEVPDESYFRRAFIEALDGEGDLNRDGVIFGTELGQFISDNVMDRFYRSKNPQTPRWGRSGGHYRGDFPFRSPASLDQASEANE